MPDENERLQELFRLYLANKISAPEYDELWSLLDPDKQGKAIAEELQVLWEQSGNEHPFLPEATWQEKMNALIAEAQEHRPAVKLKKQRSSRWAAAAAVVLLLSTGLYFYLQHSKRPEKVIVNHTENTVTQQDIRPGGNKAVLTLGNGTTIILDSAANGMVARQGGTRILKLNNGQLAYNNKGGGGQEVVYNTLTTPRGGKYQLTLPDGSEVWLNAASSIKFPTAFVGSMRQVQVSGEAYFEIAPHPSQPFEVTVGNMKVQVLGTHFDVMAYPDEASIRTTLLQGSVKVLQGNAEVLLKPGQQAQVNGKGEINLVPGVDMDKAIAWKNGLFWFDHEDIRSVMRQISRWYNVDVDIEGNIDQHFSGTLPRDVNVSKVFEVLEGTGGIHFKIEQQKIIVSP